MNITRQDEGLVSVITVQVAQTDYAENVDKVLKNYRKKANINGFRQGCAPMGMIKQMYGTYATVDEVNKLVSTSLQNYFKDNKLQVLGEPLAHETQKDANWEKDTDFEFSFDVAFAPEIKVDLTEKNSVESYKVVVSDKDIDAQVDMYCNRFGSQEDVDAIEGTEFIAGNGKKVGDEGEGSRRSFLLTRMKDEEEIAKFKAAKKDDVVTFNPKKAFNDEDETRLFWDVKKDAEDTTILDADCEMKVEQIVRFTKAIVDADLFKKAFNDDAITTEDDFRARIKTDIEKDFASLVDYKLFDNFRTKSIEDVKFDLPEEFLKRWLKDVNKDNEKVSEEDIEREFPVFLKDFRWQLISKVIFKEGNLTVDYKDVEEQAKEFVRRQFAQYGMSNVPEETLAEYSKNVMKDKSQIDRLYESAQSDKITQYIKTKITLNEKEVSVEEFQKLFN